MATGLEERICVRGMQAADRSVPVQLRRGRQGKPATAGPRWRHVG